ncbi:glycerol-3-phosphate acyltransferase mitochondrial [Cricetulus griseus]
MDESSVTLGTIDVSYLPNSSEYSLGRCKHATEDWICNVKMEGEPHEPEEALRGKVLLFLHTTELERDVHKGMFATSVTENVLNSSRVQEAIAEVAAEMNPDGSAQQQSKAIQKVKKKARKILQEMVATVSPGMIRLTGWVLLKLFNSFFWNIQIHKGQLEMVKAATELGGFFIRRRLDETPDGRKDVLYRALLHGHVVELLRQQQFLEIFLEGTRSRSGKTSCARAGLLSVVVDTLSSNTIPDILVIPVGISYDRIIEGHYNGEQLGKPKKNESLWSVARGVIRMLRKNYGYVRVDFAQPFSLKEYLESQSQKPTSAPLSLEQALLPAILPARPNDAAESEDTSSNEPRNTADEAFRRRLIANLGEHILFTASKSCAIMSTHIVACLLLYRHRQGIHLSTLVEDFFVMKEEVLARDFDLGFSGNSEDVVMHAIQLLGNCVTITHTSRKDEFFITPSTTVPSVFELNFYSNGVLHVFIMEAIIACSLYAVLNKRGSGASAGGPGSFISQEQLVRKAASLCYLLSNEGTISLPCQTFHQVCHETVGKFIQYGVLTVAEQDDQEDVSPGLAEQHWDKKLPEPLNWRSDEEDEDSDFGEEQRDCYLKVSQSKEHQQFITFLQRLLGPLLEAYSSAAIFVHNFSGPVPETEYLQKLHRYLITRTERNVAVYAESATYCLVKNAVKMFKDIGGSLGTYGEGGAVEESDPEWQVSWCDPACLTPRRPPGRCVPSAHPMDLRSSQHSHSGLCRALGAGAICDS